MTNFVNQMFAALNSNKRVEFPPIEHKYSNAHREIHNSINALMPEHKVGLERDAIQTGKNIEQYAQIYREIYFEKNISEDLKDIANEYIGLMLYSLIAEIAGELQMRGVPGAVISNAVHDAFGDVFEDYLFDSMSQEAANMRIEFRKMEYRYRAGNLGCESEYTNYSCTDEEIKAIIRQLEIDVGISSQVFFAN